MERFNFLNSAIEDVDVDGEVVEALRSNQLDDEPDWMGPPRIGAWPDDLEVEWPSYEEALGG